MGSLEEEKLLQMVHDFIESSDSSSSSSTTNSSSLLSHNFSNSPTSQKHVHFLHSTRYFTLQEILRKKTKEEEEIEEKVSKYMKNKMDMEKTTRLKKWVVKCLKMDGFRASLCHTSWITTPSCPCGNYEYIEILEEDDPKEGMTRIIVDIDFKSQFEVARPTQSYTELSSKIPMIFVGNEDKLNRIITILCSAAQDSLRERGLHIPPWRRVSYIQSKWNLHPNNTKINVVNPNTNTNNNNNGFDYYPFKLEKWGPHQNVMMKGRKELGGRGSKLSNQFSNLSINCC
ncbi:Urease accessory protein UreF [Bienertia sinuspersici]